MIYMSVPNEDGDYYAYDNEAKVVVRNGLLRMHPANSHPYEHAFNILYNAGGDTKIG